MDTTEIKVGAHVSYEDMANPLRIGVIVAFEPRYGKQWKIHWGANDVSWSDCRQAGWKLVTR